MTDIVERLRANWTGHLSKEAADEIERLRLERGTVVHMSAEIERLRAVLRCISQLDDDGEAPGLARAALEPKP
jgi:hypothetical protein